LQEELGEKERNLFSRKGGMGTKTSLFNFIWKRKKMHLPSNYRGRFFPLITGEGEEIWAPTLFSAFSEKEALIVVKWGRRGGRGG